MPKLNKTKVYYENRTVRGMVLFLSGKSWRTYQRWCSGRKVKDPYYPNNVRRYLYSHSIVKQNYQPRTVKEVSEMTQAQNYQPKQIENFRDLVTPSETEEKKYSHSDLSHIIDKEDA